MSIEVRGAKQAYLYILIAIRREETAKATRNHIEVNHCFDAADSDDEAYGRGMRFVRKLFPTHEGWTNHEVKLVRLDEIGWIGRTDIDDLKLVPRKSAKTR